MSNFRIEIKLERERETLKPIEFKWNLPNWTEKKLNFQFKNDDEMMIMMETFFYGFKSDHDYRFHSQVNQFCIFFCDQSVDDIIIVDDDLYYRYLGHVDDDHASEN